MRSRTIEFKSEAVKAWHAELTAMCTAKGEDILAVLAARGIEITPGQRTEIVESPSMKQLDEWLRRAATANSADDVFA